MSSKLTDVQEVEITVENGESVGSANINHNLKDQNGNYVNPDLVNVEFITHSASPADPVSWGFAVTRTTPADGTIAISISYSDVNATGDDVVATVRVTSMYLHSIQSNDHTA